MTAEAEIRRITKLSSVICGAPGTGIGMLIYAEIHKIAANIAIMTKLCVVNAGFAPATGFVGVSIFIIPHSYIFCLKQV